MPPVSRESPASFSVSRGREYLQLSELDLELAVPAAGALGEDVENQLGAVDGLEAGRVLEGPGLSGLEVDIEDGDGRLRAHPLEDDLHELAAPHDGPGMERWSRRWRMLPAISTPADHGQLERLLEMTRRRGHADDQSALAPAVSAGRRAPETRELLLHRLDLRGEVEVEGVDIAGGDAAEGIPSAVFLRSHGWHLGRKQRDLETARQAVGGRLDHGHEIEAQQGQIVEVVRSQGLAPQVGVDQA